MTQAVLPPEPPHQTRVAIPLSRPRLVYVLLALIGVAFGLETVLGGSTRTAVLVSLGAQVNLLVWEGEAWRLLTAMFLHIGVSHLLFNGWALYSLGRDVEAFYGTGRFATVYFASGLFGGLAFYLLGGTQTAVTVSAGASGAIFGIIGAELAYWVRNRKLFGAFGKQRLLNLAMLIGINLVFGFTIPGINNLAHLGGLVSGFLMALVLAPRYEMSWSWVGLSPSPALIDKNPAWLPIAVAAVAVLLIVAGLAVGDQRWAALAATLR